MSWRERRLITVLSIILAILSAAVLIVLGIRYRESMAQKAAAEQDPAFEVTEAAEEVGSKYIAMEYFNGATTLAFDFTEAGKWVWRYDHDFPLDTAVLEKIIAQVDSLSPQQTLTEPEDSETYGLDSPDASFTITTTDKSYIRLDFGKPTTDGKSFYCYLNGDQSTVYIFDGALLELMKTPIYDMCRLPEMPQLTPKNIVSVNLFGSEGQTDIITRVTAFTTQQLGEDTAWLVEGEKVTANPLVQAMVEDLSNLTIDRCVDYNPSDEAVEMCGFETPIARINIDYLNEAGENTYLNLTVANPLPDGSGRYVRLGEDTTIYYLPTALLDPMLPIAVHGLDH